MLTMLQRERKPPKPAHHRPRTVLSQTQRLMMENSVATQTVTASSEIEVVNQLKNQLEEKTKTCESLNKKVKDLQEANQLAAERHLLVSENLCKVSTN